jgi:hypothetical protein
MYRIDVKYKKYEGWSDVFTYKSLYPYPKDTAVVVPTGNFYSVAKVVECSQKPLPENISVRHVIGSVTELQLLDRGG